MCGVAWLVPALAANISRRQAVELGTLSALDSVASTFSVVSDPNTYDAIVHAPATSRRLPLLFVLHGAGENNRNAWDLLDANGEHRGLAPELLASGKAPIDLENEFVVVAPYSKGKRSFYEESRSKLLTFLDWFLRENEIGKHRVDPTRIVLFGFSDGATVAIELSTTRRFSVVAIAAYGFSGKLPRSALERLRDLPIWVFHSADDVIFSVAYSDRLVDSLRSVESVASDKAIVRYTRYGYDPEGCTGSVRGHCSGIAASKDPALYKWMIESLKD